MAGCDLEGFLHEFGHGLGLSHSGSRSVDFRLKNSGSFFYNSVNEYSDISSVMSLALPKRLNPGMGGLAYRGLTSLHMYYLGLLTNDHIIALHDVRPPKINSNLPKNVTGFHHIHSLSSNQRGVGTKSAVVIQGMDGVVVLFFVVDF
jgi:hypothetical protein